MDASKSTKKIYYYYGSNNTNGTAILDKNNVLFAGQCWQMIRTTDTGGVKMIYNGEVEDGKCLSTRENQTGFRALSYSVEMKPTFYYGTDYIFDKENNQFKLSGTINTGDIKVNSYTCKSTLEEGGCSELYYLLKPSGNDNYYCKNKYFFIHSYQPLLFILCMILSYYLILLYI